MKAEVTFRFAFLVAVIIGGLLTFAPSTYGNTATGTARILLERVIYTTNRHVPVVTVATDDVSLPSQVFLTVTIPSRTIRKVVVAGDVTCDDGFPLGPEVKNDVFGISLRAGQTVRLPVLRVNTQFNASCSWAMTVRGIPTRANAIHRMTIDVKGTSPFRSDGTLYNVRKCTIIERGTSTSRRCSKLFGG